MTALAMRLGCPSCEVSWTGPAGSVCWCCGNPSNVPALRIDELSIGFHHMNHRQRRPRL